MRISAVSAGSLCFSLILSACDSTITKPIGVDQNSYSLDAEQRVFLSRTRAAPDASGQRVICAEPSPDAIVAIAQSLAAQAEVAGRGGAGLSASSAETAASIGLRTATIQLLRDGLYRVCEAYANGALSEFGYALALSNFDEIMIKLISVEGLTGGGQAAQVAIGTTSSSTGSGSAQLSGPAGAAGAEGGGQISSSTETATGSSAGSIPPQIGTVTINSGDGQTADAVKAIALQARPEYHSIASACLMWYSLAMDHPDRANRQKLTSFCDQYLGTLISFLPRLLESGTRAQ